VRIIDSQGLGSGPEIVKARRSSAAGFAPAITGARDTGKTVSEGGAGGPKAAAEAASPVGKKLAELEKVSRQFESLLYKQMIHAMIEGSTEKGYYGEGSQGDVWGGLFETGLADAVSGGNSVGLGRQNYRQFEQVVRAQMAANPSAESDTPAPAAPAGPTKP
jgi:Rod binding domain-containing protein